MRNRFPIILLSLLFIWPLNAAANEIVVSIKPLHSLVQGVMGNTGQAGLVIADESSLHGFILRPSHIKLLRQAKAIFYIDNGLETFMPGALQSLPRHTLRYPITQYAGIKLLQRRTSATWEQEHHHHGDREETAMDLHIWLDAANAQQIVRMITDKLSAIYPENINTYEANAKLLINRINTMDKKLSAMLSSLQNKPFIVFHDAYQYFERRYQLNALGSITLEPNHPPSIGRIRAIQGKIRQAGIQCIFSEPQFPGKLINLVTNGTHARVMTLDPMGAKLGAGPNLYFNLLEKLAHGFTTCLN